MNTVLRYNPEIIPTYPAPKAGDRIYIRIDDLPPYKDIHFSMRNPRHKIHNRFVLLRKAAIEAMSRRAPFSGPIHMKLIMHASEFEPKRKLIDYADGIQDTLDGSHGPNFTYLPIVYEDDCQICSSIMKFEPAPTIYYKVQLEFLGNE